MTQAAQPNQIAGKTWPRKLFLVFLATLGISWIALLAKKGSSVDFYPLYFGARRMANGQSPYTSEANRELQNSWEAPFEEAGIVYPAPLLVLLVPLGILPYPVAASIWMTLGILLSSLSMLLVNDRLLRVALLFLYMPLYSAASYAQASFIWFGLSALLVLAIDREWGCWVGITAVVLALKPQDGLLFALYATWVGVTEDRRILVGMALTAIALLGISFAVTPNWIPQWLLQLDKYSAIVSPPTLLPWSLVLIVACWDLPWWAKTAALQVALFPVSAIYSTLPLLFCWLCLPPTLAVVGSSVAWLWLISDLPGSVGVLWLLILAPLVLALTITKAMSIMSNPRKRNAEVS